MKKTLIALLALTLLLPGCHRLARKLGLTKQPVATTAPSPTK